MIYKIGLSYRCNTGRCCMFYLQSVRIIKYDGSVPDQSNILLRFIYETSTASAISKTVNAREIMIA